MSIAERIRAASKRMVFGDTLLPQEFTIGLTEPQTEISVWLHGTGTPMDVTSRLTTACCGPLMLCTGVDEGETIGGEALLRFCEREGERRLLGEIRLTKEQVLRIGKLSFALFRVRGSTNYCLPRPRLWAHYLAHAYKQWRWVKNPDVKMTQVEQRAAMVTFIRPHPLVLVSLQGEAGANIFPMNLMGDLGHGYFGFALKGSRMAAHLVERERRLALSSVPLEKSSLAYSYAVHHTKKSIEWNELPFHVNLSGVFSIPFPDFALRVREMEVERVTKTGSHIFFIARVVSDTKLSDGLQVNVVHGFYQAVRLRGQRERLTESVVMDSINKRGVRAVAKN